MPSQSKSTPISRTAIAFVLLTVLALWTGALLVPVPQEKKTLTLAVNLWPGSESFILARKAGELPAERLNLVEINWTSAAMRAVGNRVVDAGVLSLDETIRQIGQGYPLKIVLVTDISHGADAVLAREGIESLVDLKGKKIGYEPRTAGAWLIQRGLRESGLSLLDVEQVPLNPAETEEIFDELKLDAVVISEPWRHRLTPLNLRTLYDSAQPGSSIVRVLVVHEEALEQYREEVLEMVRVHLRWMPRLTTLGEELEPVLRREGVSREGFLQAVKQLEFPDREQNLRWLTLQDDSLGRRLEALATQLVEDEPGVSQIQASKVFDASILEEVKP